jgi:PAS domain S-box-containing protein
MADSIRVLMVENVADDAELAADMLRQGGLDLSFQRVETETELRHALAEGAWDLILLDYALPGFSGPKALKICQEVQADAPIIIVSGSVGEQAAVQMMKEGADDYVMKGNLARLPVAAQRSMADARARRERRLAQEELRENREWLYAILRSVGEAVIAVDAQGRIRFMNHAAEHLTACTAAQALGKRLKEIVQIVDSNGEPLGNTPSREALTGNTSNSDADCLLLRKTGERITVIETASPIRDERGATIGAVIALRNITERKRAEEQLQLANQELFQFMHSVSHDLQEPLRMIRSYTDLIKRKVAGNDADANEYLRYVIEGATRMSSLLSDLRDYAEITNSESPPAERTDAEIVLQGVFVSLGSIIEETSTVIVHDPLPTLPVYSSHLAQLFQNLISNAIKYRSPESPTIRIGAIKTGNQWKFSFADNGVGIEPEHSSRVFDFFKRLHGAEIPGSGMGLTICRRIVQRYGGRIWLESTPNAGSTFYFTLPAGDPDEDSAGGHFKQE